MCIRMFIKNEKGENMNRQEMDILVRLKEKPYINQRILSEECRYSLGVINRSIKNLKKEGYLNQELELTEKARQELKEKAPHNAIILAAGPGMRMVPINTETPKGLLEIKGEPLIERIIKQLHEVGIEEIFIVVGFMKERYEYLIDEYGVDLVVNEDYIGKNNLYSMKLVEKYLANTYIIPCDIWCSFNPFKRYELYSWYMINDIMDKDSSVKVNRKMELVFTEEKTDGNTMIGIAYLLKEVSEKIREKIIEFCLKRRYDSLFWEETLYVKNKMIIPAKIVSAADVVEVNTYEQLRELDSDSNQLESDAIKVIMEVFGVNSNEIVNIQVLKKGMTNRSFLFSCKNKKYIMRIPGEGTDQLINRKKEERVYEIINGKGICDELVYINSENGYKIVEYLEGARTCDPMKIEDVSRCMKQLRQFHDMKYQVEHEFDLFEQIDFYEKLWNGTPSIYRDYEKTKQRVFSLKKYIDNHITDKVLTHIDAVPDNFLVFKNDKGEEDIRLIDWEYAGMQDPHVDIAMFSIYSLYDKNQVDRLIQIYFEKGCSENIKIKIYCYIAVCGLLWSNWCEYKRNLGIEFGKYSLFQYRYAKEYYNIVKDKLGW